MRFPLRSSVPLVLAAGALAATAGAADARTIRFAAGHGSTLSDGRIHCNVGVGEDGTGTVECSAAQVWERWERAAPCADGSDGLRAIRLRPTGRPTKGANCGVGGVEDSDRGDAIVAGTIRGRNLADGGFTFRNRSGHGFTVTASRLSLF